MNVSIHDGALHAELGPFETIFAMKHRIILPLDHITHIEVRPAVELLRPFQRMLRLPGTAIPGSVRMGHYVYGSSWEFWNVRRGQTVVVITTQDERNQSVYLGFSDDTAAMSIANQLHR